MQEPCPGLLWLPPTGCAAVGEGLTCTPVKPALVQGLRFLPYCTCHRPASVTVTAQKAFSRVGWALPRFSLLLPGPRSFFVPNVPCSVGSERQTSPRVPRLSSTSPAALAAFSLPLAAQPPSLHPHGRSFRSHGARCLARPRPQSARPVLLQPPVPCRPRLRDVQHALAPRPPWSRLVPSHLVLREAASRAHGRTQLQGAKPRGSGGARFGVGVSHKHLSCAVERAGDEF